MNHFKGSLIKFLRLCFPSQDNGFQNAQNFCIYFFFLKTIKDLKFGTHYKLAEGCFSVSFFVLFMKGRNNKCHFLTIFLFMRVVSVAVAF